MTRSKHAVLQAGLSLCALTAPLTIAEGEALLADPAFRQAGAVMSAACLADDILATDRACTAWCQAAEAAMQRERTTP